MLLIWNSFLKLVYFTKCLEERKRLYQISDYIGCTSPGNIEFVLKHNKEVVASKLNICPNSVELQGLERGDKNKSKLLKRLMIPPTKTLFIYGGNLGKPQGVNFCYK